MNVRRRRWVTALAWAGGGVALALGFAAYRRPGMAVDLANRIWSCF